MTQPLQPECYKRHADIDNHIKEGKFWRGVIVTAVLAGIGIFISQYNIFIENNNKITALNSKLTTMVEINTGRLNKIEDKILWVRGERGEKGDKGDRGDLD